jgi:hypothetical protein
MARRQRQQGKSDQQNVENRYMRQYYTNIARQRGATSAPYGK